MAVSASDGWGFEGPPCAGDKEAAAARANYAVPPACGIYYYEVEILQKGSKGYVSVSSEFLIRF